MRLRYFGGFVIDDADAPAVRGRGQESLLFRLAIDAGTTVGYRALAEDVWPDDAPEDPRAALQSLVSRLRRALPAGVIEAVPGGYRLALDRAEIDLTRFQDLVARARAESAPAAAAAAARDALTLWSGDPWTPGDGFDWVIRDLLEDRAHAERLARAAGSGQATAAMPVATTIPAALTPLVGRLDELDAIREQIAAERLVTLIGPGGAGKTTLALETARRQEGATVFVELAPAAPGEVWTVVAGAAGRSIRLSDTLLPSGSRERTLLALEGRTVLVVLDNCEHLSREAAEVAVDLLQSVGTARVLATSREPLGAPGEAFVALGPLPDDDADELFRRRVRAARGTAPSDAEADAARRIVRRLDGLPLALELAAAKTRTLSIAEVDEGLDDRFALLATGPQAIEPRHRTLRALIDWSWETLGPDERTALLTAAVFPDGIGVTDLAAVATAAGVDRLAFDQLVDRSLLRRSDGRLRTLETVREYGIDRLRAQGLEAQFRARQAEVMAGLAAAHDAMLRGPGVRRGLAWFDANDENLSAALRTSSGPSGDRMTGVRLVRGSLWAWMMRERFEELQAGMRDFGRPDLPLDSEAAVVVGGIALLFATVAAAGGFGAEATAFAADAAGDFESLRQGLTEAAERHPSELAAAVPPLLAGAAAAMRDSERDGESRSAWPPLSFHIPELTGDSTPAWTRAFIAMLRSAIAQNSGDVDTLGRESEQALTMFLALDDRWGIAFSSQMRSEWLMLEGRLEEALAVADASTAGLTGLTSITDVVQQRAQGVNLLLRLGRIDDARVRLGQIQALADEDGSARAIGQARMNAATVEIAAGDGAAALAELDALDPEFEGGYPDQMIGWAGSRRTQALLLLGRRDEAREVLRRVIPAAQRSGDQPILADVALSLAGWLAAEGRDADAHRALAVSASLRGRADEADPFLRRLRTQLDAAPEETSDAASDLTALAALLE
ncbi:ATP-binding protein [Microbacterium terricola]|uniref:SARP family transcriptional regulator n=1 Tax=Microbacterium terricola TaxID=344163 RepID=A0ABM8E341_9MICO|nr:ATPase [Microbacterium terricola]UYK40164.1 ATPase [Microbacterium terricola]BDV32131.1 SARP family transcriptional regulator [Microbacterium terricola]